LSNPLEAELDITASPAVLEALGTVTDPAAFLGVSRVSVATGDAGEGPAKVTARPGSGEKCERCWRRDVTVSAQTDHPTLCSRCAGVIRGKE
jgi:isoleucyl-tRNA synthetase